MEVITIHYNNILMEYVMNYNQMYIFRFSLNYFLSGGRARQANASVRAAFVHVVGDLLQSISVLVSAIIIFFKVSGLSGCSPSVGSPTE